MATPRPHLDSMTIWRAEQVAKAEGRTLPNAIARLVTEAWDHRMVTRTRTCFPPDVAERILAAGRPASAA
jgi:hypothetical protein